MWPKWRLVPISFEAGHSQCTVTTMSSNIVVELPCIAPTIRMLKAAVAALGCCRDPQIRSCMWRCSFATILCMQSRLRVLGALSLPRLVITSRRQANALQQRQHFHNLHASRLCARHGKAWQGNCASCELPTNDTAMGCACLACFYRRVSPMHVGLLFVNVRLLNRNQVCRSWSRQMIKVMQMEILNVTVLMPPRRTLVMTVI
jgi:hypothetical protein